MVNPKLIVTLGVAILLAGCVGPPGPPLGLGPLFDGAVGFLLVVVLLAGVSYGVLRVYRNGAPTASKSDAAAEIVRQRFARGEIQADEFHAILQHLNKTSGRKV